MNAVIRMEAPPDAVTEMVTAAMPDDERLWVPEADDVCFRPLHFNTVSGGWVSLLRVRRAGVLSRHRHPAPVHGLVLEGSWRYLEHDWVARAGDYIFEPPGEVHTLVVDADVEQMVTFFNVQGALIYCDEAGTACGYDDVHTKIELARAHFERVGLGADYVRRFIR